MAKKRTASRKVKKSAIPKTDGGPLTIEQARRIVRSAAAAKKAVGKQAAAASTIAPLQLDWDTREKPLPQVLEDERRRQARLMKQRDKERTREYKEMMALLEKRGIKGLTQPAATSGGGLASSASTRPLRILAEGDSWFDYPVPLFGQGIIRRLEKRIRIPILNLADAGDEVRFMLGVEQRQQLIERLKNGSPAGGAWDVLLFSGGGNDIVGNPMALWILDHDPNLTPAQQINGPRYKAALDLVRAGYEDLITLRDKLSPATRLYFHAYDFAFPSNKGVCGKGPWLAPTFDARGFPKGMQRRFLVVKEMLIRLKDMLAKFANKPSNNVGLVDTQGAMPTQVSSWHNELHPSKTGFNTMTERFRSKLKIDFPGRVF